MIIKNVPKDDPSDVIAFIENMGNSQKTFRYFDKRNISCLKNHFLTQVLYDYDLAEYPIGYAHIEKDDVFWFGICISEKFVGMGYGKTLMRNILRGYDANFTLPLYLSVDSINSKAIKLYENEGFSITEKKETFCYMKRVSPDADNFNI